MSHPTKGVVCTRGMSIDSVLMGQIDIVMACIVMAYIVMAYIVMAYIVMTYVVMAMGQIDVP